MRPNSQNFFIVVTLYTLACRTVGLMENKIKSHISRFSVHYEGLTLRQIETLVRAYSSVYNGVSYTVRKSPKSYILNLEGEKIPIQGEGAEGGFYARTM